MRRWLHFFTGLFAILLFAFVLIPSVQQWQPVRQVRSAVQNSGIDPTALFYSESTVSYEAENSIRHAIQFTQTAKSTGSGKGRASFAEPR